uniref:RNase NYN domain-containing protein n=1 Tax=Setaria digitata TaxID=48799 RepID=A0A915PH21_9BILA
MAQDVREDRLTEGELSSAGKHLAKRLLVIDAMNVMHMGTGPVGRQLDCLSILPIVRYFVRRGHAVEIVMPEFCIYKNCFKNSHIWKELAALRLLILVPYMVHDDLVALTVARDSCGSVITQDKFRDHLACFPQLYQVRSRNIVLSFMNNEKATIFFTSAKGDKYYKHYFSCMNYSFGQFYSLPEDDDYDLVKDEKWSKNRRNEVLKYIDKIYGLAEAQYVLARGQRSSNGNSHTKAPKSPFSVDTYKNIVKEGKKTKKSKKQKSTVVQQNLGALLCWRNTAERQELKYQLKKRLNGMCQRCSTSGFMEDNLQISDSTDFLILQETLNNKDLGDGTRTVRYKELFSRYQSS